MAPLVVTDVLNIRFAHFCGPTLTPLVTIFTSTTVVPPQGGS